MGYSGWMCDHLTCLLKNLSSRLRRGGSGACVQSRSGGRVPWEPNTFRSLKHSVSIIWRTGYHNMTAGYGNY